MAISEIEKYRVDHLILLVGGNPLPNYVAARLLAKQGATLWLVHTPKTLKLSEQLLDALGRPAEGSEMGFNFAGSQRLQVDENSPRDIFNAVQCVLSKIPSNKTVGLNYTSGNRPMSVHTYDAVKMARPEAIFSYLNANSLEMLVHDSRQTTLQRFRADKLLNMQLETLFTLQGLKEKEPPASRPNQPELAAAIAKVNSNNEGVNAWWAWRRNGSDGWKKLPQNQPGLAEIENAIHDLCEGNPSPEKVAGLLGYESLHLSANWWKGKWLEDYVFIKLGEAIQGRTDTNDAVRSIKRIREGNNGKDFELDVAVMRSYQLFVFSCIASNDRQSCKDHLMEAYVRARQAGGDEARVGLVCLTQNSVSLAEEISSTLDAQGKIKVFGQKELLSLSDHIKGWINQQP